MIDNNQRFNGKEDVKLKNLFLILTLAMFLSAVVLSSILVIHFSIVVVVLIALCLVLMIVFYVLAIMKFKGYKLKNMHNKEFTLLINESIKKFKNAPDWFIQNYIEDTKTTYQKTGKLFFKEDNDWLYRDEFYKDKIINAYKMLYDSIVSKGCFVQFCVNLTKDIILSEQEGYDEWNVHLFFNLDMISGELVYLMNEVFKLNYFFLFGDECPEEYALKNEYYRVVLNDIYSPILFGFEEEVKSVLEKITAK